MIFHLVGPFVALILVVVFMPWLVSLCRVFLDDDT